MNNRFVTGMLTIEAPPLYANSVLLWDGPLWAANFPGLRGRVFFQ